MTKNSTKAKRDTQNSIVCIHYEQVSLHWHRCHASDRREIVTSSKLCRRTYLSVDVTTSNPIKRYSLSSSPLLPCTPARTVAVYLSSVFVDTCVLVDWAFLIWYPHHPPGNCLHNNKENSIIILAKLQFMTIRRIGFIVFRRIEKDELSQSRTHVF